MRFRKKQRNRISSILYYVPLVNVVFLLIFFAVVLNTLSSRPDSMVENGLSKKIQVSSEPISLSILPGGIMLDGKQTQKQALSSIPHGKKIVITVSPEISYQNLADILDVLRSSGHAYIYFSTNPIHN